MPSRTFAIGDIHGDLGLLERMLATLRDELRDDDTVVFLGDYVDRGPDSRGVIDCVRRFTREFRGRTVALRGNHEDAWLDSLARPNPAFLLPASNGCVEMMRSFSDAPLTDDAETFARLFEPARWLPELYVAWLRALPTWYEDEHALYVHAGLERDGRRWRHPSRAHGRELLWTRDPEFFREYRGKRVVFGHTLTRDLPSDVGATLHSLVDERPGVWLAPDRVGLDTGCGKGGFLSAVELPSLRVFEVRP